MWSAKLVKTHCSFSRTVHILNMDMLYTWFIFKPRLDEGIASTENLNPLWVFDDHVVYLIFLTSSSFLSNLS